MLKDIPVPPETKEDILRLKIFKENRDNGMSIDSAINSLRGLVSRILNTRDIPYPEAYWQAYLDTLVAAIKEAKVVGFAEDGSNGAPRNCDRFNTGNPHADLGSAIKHFAAETGTTVYNLNPGFNSAGDFALWLMSATKEKQDRFNSTRESDNGTAQPQEDRCEVVMETICNALQTVANNRIGNEQMLIQSIIHTLKSEWEHRRHII